jgi:hypothetical protein
LEILFPSEGQANLEGYRSTAVEYLNTAVDGVTVSPFSQLATDSAEYDTRVRGMLALLLASQRFQEQ